MMAIAALSLPEAVMLRRAMKLPLIAIFFAVTTLGIIFTGYLFNILQISTDPILIITLASLIIYLVYFF